MTTQSNANTVYIKCKRLRAQLRAQKNYLKNLSITKIANGISAIILRGSWYILSQIDFGPIAEIISPSYQRALVLRPEKLEV